MGMATAEPGVTDKDRQTARASAEFAARRGLDPARACPYNPAGSPRDRILARVWIDRFLFLRPPKPGTVNHDDQPQGS